MAESELVALLLGGLVAVLGVARFPATRLPWSWLASIVLVRLAVVAPQALPSLSWQPWLLAAALIALVAALVTLGLMWHWMLQEKVLTVPPGTPPLFHTLSGGIVLSGMSTGGLPAPLWIGLLLALNGTLMSVLGIVWVRKSVQQAKQSQNNSGAGTAS